MSLSETATTFLSAHAWRWLLQNCTLNIEVAEFVILEVGNLWHGICQHDAILRFFTRGMLMMSSEGAHSLPLGPKCFDPAVFLEP